MSKPQMPQRNVASPPSSDESPGSTSSQSKSTESVDLSTTLGAFEQRFQRRKSALKVAETEAEKAQRIRQGLLLNSMMSIRRSLNQITKIDLGDRFSLTLEADDWQGWPRLLVRIFDDADPRAEYPYLQVLAHDRLERANIEISQSTLPRIEKLALVEQQDQDRLPTVLKRSVRTFLDLVEKIVVDGELSGEPEEAAPPIQNVNLDPNDSQEMPALSGDIYVDDHELVEDGEKLPVLDQLEALPDINSKLNIE